MTERAPSRWPLLAVAAIALLYHIFLYFPYMVDDAFISLRYAQRLLQGRGLTWNDGEYVEGYSNLLWVLLNAALGYLGMPLELAARWLGALSTLLLLPVFSWHARRAGIETLALAAGMAVFVVTPPVGIWAMAGLETPLVMLLLAGAAALCYRLLSQEKLSYAFGCSAALAPIILLRPEGPLYIIAVALGLALCSALPLFRRVRLAAIISLLPLIFFCGQLIFRLAEYGQWLPNTVLVKVAFSGARFFHGFMYTVKGVISFLPLLLYVGFNAASARGKSVAGPSLRFIAFLLTVFLFLAAAIFLGGGDIFKGFRAFVPLVPLLALAIMHAVTLGMKETQPQKEGVFFLVVLAGYVWSQFAIDVNQVSGPGHHWEQDAKGIGLTLKEKYGAKQPLVAVHAAGAIPFYSQLPALDIFGLNDSHLAERRREQKRFGTQLAGHELFDGNYVESRKPDILAFEIPGLPPLCADNFEKECAVLLPHYRPEKLYTPGGDVTIWLRKDSEKLK